MTIDEAIKEIREASDSEVRYGDTEYHYDEVMKRIEALDLAIKALEQQPSEDCVNREAVAEMLNEMPMKITETWMDFYRKALNSLNKLPSVTPQRPKGKWKPLNYKDEMWGYVYECSNCGYIDYGNDYCPKCGADMREREVNADES